MIAFGGVDLDPVELGINGNAILGIKESGKSYLGTELGEIFFDNDIPFVTFDPIGLWHNMRYPGRGKGYPIVVAGGFHGDIPLTVATAPAIVEAAMRNRVSLVIDLFHPELSKGDWHKIVKDCCFLLLHKNAQYGLRHVFIEEAAEFVPQNIRDGQLYDAVERVIRMGGNSRLGCTLITPRSQEVNKAVLELCENLFLFRQRGKNALENLKKWLEIAGNDAKNVIATLPKLEKGQCWAWLGGGETPVLIQVPQKSSFHPDRRQMGADAGDERRKPVSATKFVKTLTAELPKVEEEAAANDPKRLKAKIAALEKQIAGKPGNSPAPVSSAADQERIRVLEEENGQLRASVAVVGTAKGALERARKREMTVREAVNALGDEMDRLDAVLVGAPAAPPPAPRAIPRSSPRGNGAIATPNSVQMRPAAAPADRDITGRLAELVDKIAWAEVFFRTPAVERQILAFLVKKHPRTKGFINDLSELSTRGIIEYVPGGKVQLTAEGRKNAAWPENASRDDMLNAIRATLQPRQFNILERVLDGEGGQSTRKAVADYFGLHERTKGLLNDLSRLRTLGLISYGSQGALFAADYLKER